MSLETSLSSVLADQGYLRERLQPRRGDDFYLHLVDLLAALRPITADPAETVLDYGCGGSPYRRLFSQRTYHRTDLPGTPGLDHAMDEAGRVDAPDASYELVLCTQVLEHVRHPGAVLRECLRLLKPGGRLVVTTHGLFEEHGCPADFRRWTADGLAAEMQDAGAQNVRVQKITFGGRAWMFFMDRWSCCLTGLRSQQGRRGMQLVLGLWRRLQPAWHRLADALFAHQAVAPAGTVDSMIYVGLMAVGEKPTQAPE
jgi:SAM-dependent methyltransferase